MFAVIIALIILIQIVNIVLMILYPNKPVVRQIAVTYGIALTIILCVFGARIIGFYGIIVGLFISALVNYIGYQAFMSTRNNANTNEQEDSSKDDFQDQNEDDQDINKQ